MMRKLVIALSLSIGLVSVLPYIVAYVLVSPVEGEKLGYFYHDSELVYLSRIREITEGNIHVSSPAFLEYKNAPHIQQPFSEWMYALLSFGSPELVTSIAMILKFVFPAMLFILAYVLVREILTPHILSERRRYIALGIATFVLLGYDLNNSSFIQQLFSGTFTSPVLSIWTRMVHPITGALGLFFVSYVLFTSERKHNQYFIILAGLVLGVLSGYIFSYALGMVLVTCMLAFAILERDISRAKKFLAIILISLIVNIFYIVKTLTISGDVGMLEKNGLLLTHQLLHNKVLYIAAGVFLIWTALFYRGRVTEGIFWKHRGWQWSASVLLAGFICLNQQVLTGKTVWPGHFVQYTNPIAFIIFFTSAVYILEYCVRGLGERMRLVYQKYVPFACMLGVVLLVGMHVFSAQSVLSNQAEYQNIQRYEKMLSWLEESREDECVVFVVEERERIEKFITAYTGCDLYHSSFVFYAVPDERVLHNYIVHLRLLGVTREYLDEYLTLHEEYLREYFFKSWVDKFGNGRDEWVFNTKPYEERMSFIGSTKAMIIEAFEETEGQSLDALLKQYRIDYITYDSGHEVLSFAGNRYPKVYDAQGIVVLKVQ